MQPPSDPRSSAALEADIDAMRKRLAEAESVRRACHKKYLESCSTIYALVQELEQLHKARASAQTGHGAGARRLMAEFGIRFDGKVYWSATRSYPRLGDAISDARALRGLPAVDPGITSSTPVPGTA